MREHLLRLHNNLRRLERLRAGPIGEVERWALRYGLYESIQIMIDLCCHLVNRLELGPPESYRDCVRKLTEAGHLPEDLGERLIDLVYFRNLLAHAYAKIDDAEVQEKLNCVEDLYRFVEIMEGYFS